MMKIERYMTRNPYTIESAASLAAAAETMKDCGVRHLPVVNEGSLCGLLSERDLMEAHALEKSADLSVSDVMKRDVLAVSCDRELRDVVDLMADRRYGSAIVLDRRGDVAGIFTTIDALHLLSAFIGQDMEALEPEENEWIEGTMSL